MSAGDIENEMSASEKTALFIAWERALESKRPDALFSDPLAEKLVGESGEASSGKFASVSSAFGLGDWSEYHQQWTAVRTTYIDRWLNTSVENAGDSAEHLQVVNLGAGVCTRPYRLECLSKVRAVFQVDLENMTKFRQRVLASLDDIEPLARSIVDISYDLSGDTLGDVLEEAGFLKERPTLWILEGIIMYIPIDRQRALLDQVAEASAPGSGALVNFMGEDERNPMSHKEAELQEQFERQGWDSTMAMFGEEKLDFGRFDHKYEPIRFFSFAELKK